MIAHEATEKPSSTNSTTFAIGEEPTTSAQTSSPLGVALRIGSTREWYATGSWATSVTGPPAPPRRVILGLPKNDLPRAHPMLKTLRIRNLVTIEDLRVEFGPGLNVLTGETGAGKSIVVDALGLASGERGDSALIRSGTDRAVIEAAFDLAPRGPLAELLAARGLDAEGEELVVRRELAAS